MSTQFISCTFKKEDGSECPLSEQKQCHARKIVVDDEGKCATGQLGPFEGKSEVENYVEISRCDNQKCRHWEFDDAHDVGQCGFRSDLFVNHDGKCDEFARQISEPGFWATVQDKHDPDQK